MDKKTLAKLPAREASPEAVSQAKRIKAVKAYISADTAEAGGEKVLIMDVYLSKELKTGNTKAAYRAFVGCDDYITLDMGSKGAKWLTGKLYSVLGRAVNGYYPTEDKFAFADDDSIRKVSEYFNSDLPPLRAIDEFQGSVLAGRLAAKHKKITDRIDAKMALVPPLPGDWDGWLRKTALPESRYIFYDYKAGKGTQTGRCTYCGATVEIQNPRYNGKGVCPACGAAVIFRSSKKAARRASGITVDRGEAAIVQRVGSEIVARSFIVTRRHYPATQRGSETTAFEVCRDIFGAEDGYKIYEWRKFKMTDAIRWCEGSRRYYLSETVVYAENIDAALESTRWQYSALRQYATRHSGAKVNVFRYFDTYERHPFVEYLVKLRLYRLVGEMTSRHGMCVTSINEKGETLADILGVGKEHLPMLQDLDADGRDLSLIQTAVKMGVRLTADGFREFVEKNGHNGDLLEMTRYATLRKLTRYLDEQSAGRNRSNVFSDFADYIGYCEEMGHDLRNEFVLFPRKLKKAHDTAYKRVLKIREEKEQALRRELAEKSVDYFRGLQDQYGWEYGDFVVAAPSSLYDIISEGQTLHHCAGIHAEKAAKGETVILFLRKKEEPEKPYYTIEVAENKVVQCRGRNNKDMPDEIKKIIDAYNERNAPRQMRRKAAGA